MATFGQRLRTLRNQNAMTGEELGKIFNVTKTAISNWENGNRFPDEKTLVKIAEYFDTTLDYILGRTDIKNLHEEDKKQDDTIPIAAHFKGKEMTEEQRKRIEKFIEFTLNEDD